MRPQTTVTNNINNIGTVQQTEKEGRREKEHTKSRRSIEKEQVDRWKTKNNARKIQSKKGKTTIMIETEKEVNPADKQEKLRET